MRSTLLCYSNTIAQQCSNVLHCIALLLYCYSVGPLYFFLSGITEIQTSVTEINHLTFEATSAKNISVHLFTCFTSIQLVYLYTQVYKHGCKVYLSVVQTVGGRICLPKFRPFLLTTKLSNGMSFKKLFPFEMYLNHKELIIFLAIALLVAEIEFHRSDYYACAHSGCQCETQQNHIGHT